jgi:hypothetical protein
MTKTGWSVAGLHKLSLFQMDEKDRSWTSGIILVDCATTEPLFFNAQWRLPCLNWIYHHMLIAKWTAMLKIRKFDCPEVCLVCHPIDLWGRRDDGSRQTRWGDSDANSNAQKVVVIFYAEHDIEKASSFKRDSNDPFVVDAKNLSRQNVGSVSRLGLRSAMRKIKLARGARRGCRWW